MRPIVTIDEMRAVDAGSPVAESELIRRAGTAVYFAARRMLGGTYGRHVVLVAGKGNNGADGRIAARMLQQRGVRVTHVDPDVSTLPMSDLVIDAAYGTGFYGEYRAPKTSAPVLAVDIPSGVNGNSGIAAEGAFVAQQTVALAALKPGHLFHNGPVNSGEVNVVDIGLDVSRAQLQLLEREDVVVPQALRDAHKWQTAVAIVAGSPGMLGAARLSAAGAARSGSGMVRLFVPGCDEHDLPVSEAVASSVSQEGWADEVLRIAERVKAIVVGPGLGRDLQTIVSINELIAKAPVPVVIDADALFAVAHDPSALRSRSQPAVVTPHDGEFKMLTGSAPADERWQSAIALGQSMSCTALLKGSTSVVATPGETTLLSHTGDTRLATAGTGDVLSGMVGAFIARGLTPRSAAASAAYVHGAASRLGYSDGLIASDLPELIARWMSNG